jgi:hypothetical protein
MPNHVDGQRSLTPQEHNTVFPYQANYQKPDYRVDPEHQPRVTARAVNVDGSVVEKAHAAFENAATQFEKHLATIDFNDYTNEGARKRITEFKGTGAAKAADAALDSVRDRRDKAAARVEHLKRELSPAGDTATELRNSRFWDRTAKILDGIEDYNRLSNTATDLIAKASRAELGMLLQELEPYMLARVQTFDSPRARESLLNGYTTAIDAATDKAVPEYSKAKRQLSQAEKAFQVTDHNSKFIRDQFCIAAPGAYRRPRFIDPRRYDPDK